MKLFDKTWKLALSGVVIGLLVMLLAMSGNPANMAICVACFIRDAAGALKLHTAAPVQYFRPEIVGFVCGSFLISMATKEYRSTAGSAPMVRFLLGAVMMIGALVFLGCPLRMVLRMSAGDLNAYVALIGFAGGVATGSCFLKKGFSLGRAYETKSLSGAVLPVLLAALLVIGVATGAYAASTEGPGSKHAPLLLALVVALVIGALAQKSRMCFAGSIRDVILMKNFDLLSIIAALFAVMTIYNIATGNFHLSFSGQPIAHSQHLWNILGMVQATIRSYSSDFCMKNLLPTNNFSHPHNVWMGFFVYESLGKRRSHPSIFWITAPSQRHRVSPARLAISSTRAWLCFTVWMPVAIFVIQLTASTFIPR